MSVNEELQLTISGNIAPIENELARLSQDFAKFSQQLVNLSRQPTGPDLSGMEKTQRILDDITKQQSVLQQKLGDTKRALDMFSDVSTVAGLQRKLEELAATAQKTNETIAKSAENAAQRIQASYDKIRFPEGPKGSRSEYGGTTTSSGSYQPAQAPRSFGGGDPGAGFREYQDAQKKAADDQKRLADVMVKINDDMFKDMIASIDRNGDAYVADLDRFIKQAMSKRMPVAQMFAEDEAKRLHAESLHNFDLQLQAREKLLKEHIAREKQLFRQMATEAQAHATGVSPVPSTPAFQKSAGQAQSAKELENNIYSANRAIAAMEIALSRVTAPAGAWSSALRTLGFHLDATTQAAIAAGVVFAGLGASVIVAFAGALKAANDFDKAIGVIRAVAGEKTFGPLEDQTRRVANILGKDTVFSSVQAAQAIGQLVKSGIPLQEALEGAAKAALGLAAATGEDVVESARTAAQVMRIFSEEVEQGGLTFEKTANVMTASVAAAGVEMTAFRYAMEQVGPTAQLLGQRFTATAAAVDVMAKAGYTGEKAGTALNSMLLRLAPTNMRAYTAMALLGTSVGDTANSFYDAEGKLKSFADVAGILEKQTAGLDKVQKQQLFTMIFGTEGMRAAFVMTQQGADALRAMEERITRNNAAQEAMNARLQGLYGATELFKSSVESVAVAIGGHLTPILTPFIALLTTLVNTFLDMPEAMQSFLVVSATVVGALMLISGTMAALTIVTQRAGLNIGGLGSFFTAAAVQAKLTAAAMWELTAAQLANNAARAAAPAAGAAGAAAAATQLPLFGGAATSVAAQNAGAFATVGGAISRVAVAFGPAAIAIGTFFALYASNMNHFRDSTHSVLSAVSFEWRWFATSMERIAADLGDTFADIAKKMDQVGVRVTTGAQPGSPLANLGEWIDRQGTKVIASQMRTTASDDKKLAERTANATNQAEYGRLIAQGISVQGLPADDPKMAEHIVSRLDSVIARVTDEVRGGLPASEALNAAIRDQIINVEGVTGGPEFDARAKQLSDQVIPRLKKVSPSIAYQVTGEAAKTQTPASMEELRRSEEMGLYIQRLITKSRGSTAQEVLIASAVMQERSERAPEQEQIQKGTDVGMHLKQLRELQTIIQGASPREASELIFKQLEHGGDTASAAVATLSEKYKELGFTTAQATALARQDTVTRDASVKMMTDETKATDAATLAKIENNKARVSFLQQAASTTVDPRLRAELEIASRMPEALQAGSFAFTAVAERAGIAADEIERGLKAGLSFQQIVGTLDLATRHATGTVETAPNAAEGGKVLGEQYKESFVKSFAATLPHEMGAALIQGMGKLRKDEMIDPQYVEAMKQLGVGDDVARAAAEGYKGALDQVSYALERRARVSDEVALSNRTLSAQEDSAVNALTSGMTPAMRAHIQSVYIATDAEKGQEAALRAVAEAAGVNAEALAHSGDMTAAQFARYSEFTKRQKEFTDQSDLATDALDKRNRAFVQTIVGAVGPALAVEIEYLGRQLPDATDAATMATDKLRISHEMATAAINGSKLAMQEVAAITAAQQYNETTPQPVAMQAMQNQRQRSFNEETIGKLAAPQADALRDYAARTADPLDTLGKISETTGISLTTLKSAMNGNALASYELEKSLTQLKLAATTTREEFVKLGETKAFDENVAAAIGKMPQSMRASLTATKEYEGSLAALNEMAKLAGVSTETFNASLEGNLLATYKVDRALKTLNITATTTREEFIELSRVKLMDDDLVSNIARLPVTLRGTVEAIKEYESAGAAANKISELTGMSADKLKASMEGNRLAVYEVDQAFARLNLNITTTHDEMVKLSQVKAFDENTASLIGRMPLAMRGNLEDIKERQSSMAAMSEIAKATGLSVETFTAALNGNLLAAYEVDRALTALNLTASMTREEFIKLSKLKLMDEQTTTYIAKMPVALRANLEWIQKTESSLAAMNKMAELTGISVEKFTAALNGNLLAAYQVDKALQALNLTASMTNEEYVKLGQLKLIDDTTVQTIGKLPPLLRANLEWIQKTQGSMAAMNEIAKITGVSLETQAKAAAGDALAMKTLSEALDQINFRASNTLETFSQLQEHARAETLFGSLSANLPPVIKDFLDFQKNAFGAETALVSLAQTAGITAEGVKAAMAGNKIAMQEVQEAVDQMAARMNTTFNDYLLKAMKDASTQMLGTFKDLPPALTAAIEYLKATGGSMEALRQTAMAFGVSWQGVVRDLRAGNIANSELAERIKNVTSAMTAQEHAAKIGGDRIKSLFDQVKAAMSIFGAANLEALAEQFGGGARGQLAALQQTGRAGGIPDQNIATMLTTPASHLPEKFVENIVDQMAAQSAGGRYDINKMRLQLPNITDPAQRAEWQRIIAESSKTGGIPSLQGFPTPQTPYQREIGRRTGETKAAFGESMTLDYEKGVASDNEWVKTQLQLTDQQKQWLATAQKMSDPSSMMTNLANEQLNVQTEMLAQLKLLTGDTSTTGHGGAGTGAGGAAGTGTGTGAAGGAGAPGGGTGQAGGAAGAAGGKPGGGQGTSIYPYGFGGVASGASGGSAGAPGANYGAMPPFAAAQQAAAAQAYAMSFGPGHSVMPPFAQPGNYPPPRDTQSLASAADAGIPIKGGLAQGQGVVLPPPRSVVQPVAEAIATAVAEAVAEAVPEPTAAAVATAVTEAMPTPAETARALTGAVSAAPAATAAAVATAVKAAAPMPAATAAAITAAMPTPAATAAAITEAMPETTSAASAIPAAVASAVADALPAAAAAVASTVTEAMPLTTAAVAPIAANVQDTIQNAQPVPEEYRLPLLPDLPPMAPLEPLPPLTPLAPPARTAGGTNTPLLGGLSVTSPDVLTSSTPARANYAASPFSIDSSGRVTNYPPPSDNSSMPVVQLANEVADAARVTAGLAVAAAPGVLAAAPQRPSDVTNGIGAFVQTGVGQIGGVVQGAATNAQGIAQAAQAPLQNAVDQARAAVAAATSAAAPAPPPPPEEESPEGNLRSLRLLHAQWQQGDDWRRFGPATPAPTPIPPEYVAPIQSASAEYGLDPGTYAGLLFHESGGWNPNAYGAPDGMGLSQLEALARRFTGIQDPYDPQQSIHAGAQWLGQLGTELGGSPPMEQLLAAYNAGTPAVGRAVRSGRPLTDITARSNYIPLIQAYGEYYNQFFQPGGAGEPGEPQPMPRPLLPPTFPEGSQPLRLLSAQRQAPPIPEWIERAYQESLPQPPQPAVSPEVAPRLEPVRNVPIQGRNPADIPGIVVRQPEPAVSAIESVAAIEPPPTLAAASSVSLPPLTGAMRVDTGFTGTESRPLSQEATIPTLGKTLAYELCGPAAAAWFVQQFHRQPELAEVPAIVSAYNLASSMETARGGSGFLRGRGMGGTASEVGLIGRGAGAGADAAVQAEAMPLDFARVAEEVTAHRPVLLNSPAHYYQISDVRQNARGEQEFNTGVSGPVLGNYGGQQWMTAAQFAAMRPVPQGPGKAPAASAPGNMIVAARSEIPQAVREAYEASMTGGMGPGAEEVAAPVAAAVTPVAARVPASNIPGGVHANPGVRGQIVSMALQRFGVEGARALEAILFGESGEQMGDFGKSAGPFQFFGNAPGEPDPRTGQLNNFARDNNFPNTPAGLQRARQHIQANPLEAANWAFNNYLGTSTQGGLRRGLGGQELMNYIISDSQNPDWRTDPAVVRNYQAGWNAVQRGGIHPDIEGLRAAAATDPNSARILAQLGEDDGPIAQAVEPLTRAVTANTAAVARTTPEDAEAARVAAADRLTARIAAQRGVGAGVGPPRLTRPDGSPLVETPGGVASIGGRTFGSVGEALAAQGLTGAGATGTDQYAPGTIGAALQRNRPLPVQPVDAQGNPPRGGPIPLFGPGPAQSAPQPRVQYSSTPFSGTRGADDEGGVPAGMSMEDWIHQVTGQNVTRVSKMLPDEMRANMLAAGFDPDAPEFQTMRNGVASTADGTPLFGPGGANGTGGTGVGSGVQTNMGPMGQEEDRRSPEEKKEARSKYGLDLLPQALQQVTQSHDVPDLLRNIAEILKELLREYHIVNEKTITAFENKKEADAAREKADAAAASAQAYNMKPMMDYTGNPTDRHGNPIWYDRRVDASAAMPASVFDEHQLGAAIDPDLLGASLGDGEEEGTYSLLARERGGLATGNGPASEPGPHSRRGPAAAPVPGTGVTPAATGGARSSSGSRGQPAFDAQGRPLTGAGQVNPSLPYYGPTGVAPAAGLSGPIPVVMVGEDGVPVSNDPYHLPQPIPGDFVFPAPEGGPMPPRGFPPIESGVVPDVPGLLEPGAPGTLPAPPPGALPPMLKLGPKPPKDEPKQPLEPLKSEIKQEGVRGGGNETLSTMHEYIAGYDKEGKPIIKQWTTEMQNTTSTLSSVLKRQVDDAQASMSDIGHIYKTHTNKVNGLVVSMEDSINQDMTQAVKVMDASWKNLWQVLIPQSTSGYGMRENMESYQAWQQGKHYTSSGVGPTSLGISSGYSNPSVAMPQYALGSLVTTPRVAMIGEAGPEAIIPLSRGADAAYRQLASYLQQTSGGGSGESSELMTRPPQQPSAQTVPGMPGLVAEPRRGPDGRYVQSQAAAVQAVPTPVTAAPGTSSRATYEDALARLPGLVAREAAARGVSAEAVMPIALRGLNQMYGRGEFVAAGMRGGNIDTSWYRPEGFPDNPTWQISKIDSTTPFAVGPNGETNFVYPNGLPAFPPDSSRSGDIPNMSPADTAAYAQGMTPFVDVFGHSTQYADGGLITEPTLAQLGMVFRDDAQLDPSQAEFTAPSSNPIVRGLEPWTNTILPRVGSMLTGTDARSRQPAMVGLPGHEIPREVFQAQIEQFGSENQRIVADAELRNQRRGEQGAVPGDTPAEAVSIMQGYANSGMHNVLNPFPTGTDDLFLTPYANGGLITRPTLSLLGSGALRELAEASGHGTEGAEGGEGGEGRSPAWWAQSEIPGTREWLQRHTAYESMVPPDEQWLRSHPDVGADASGLTGALGPTTMSAVPEGFHVLTPAEAARLNMPGGGGVDLDNPITNMLENPLAAARTVPLIPTVSGAGAAVEGLADALRPISIARDVLPMVADAAPPVRETLQATGATVGAYAQNRAQAAQEATASLVGGAQTGISNLANMLTGSGGQEIVDPIGVSGTGVMQIAPSAQDVPEVPHFANGGIVTSPTLAMVGERGPEMITPITQGMLDGPHGDIALPNTAPSVSASGLSVDAARGSIDSSVNIGTYNSYGNGLNELRTSQNAKLRSLRNR